MIRMNNSDYDDNDCKSPNDCALTQLRGGELDSPQAWWNLEIAMVRADCSAKVEPQPTNRAPTLSMLQRLLGWRERTAARTVTHSVSQIVSQSDRQTDNSGAAAESSPGGKVHAQRPLQVTAPGCCKSGRCRSCVAKVTSA